LSPLNKFIFGFWVIPEELIHVFEELLLLFWNDRIFLEQICSVFFCYFFSGDKRFGKGEIKGKNSLRSD
jgi:hypothetical protein